VSPVPSKARSFTLKGDGRVGSTVKTNKAYLACLKKTLSGPGIPGKHGIGIYGSKDLSQEQRTRGQTPFSASLVFEKRHG